MTELLESALHNCALTHYLEKFKGKDITNNYYTKVLHNKNFANSQ